MYDSLLLDHDGVLVSVLDHDQRLAAFRRHAAAAFEEAGIDPPAELLPELNTGFTPEELQKLSQRHGFDPEQLWRCRDDGLAAVLTEASRAGEKIPYDDIRALSDSSLPRGIVSNNQRRVVEDILSQHGHLDQFETIRAREPRVASLENKKPAPTMLEQAKADLDSENPLYVGDKETDIVAGQRAGMDVAFIRRSHNADRTLDTEPTYEVSDLEAVVDICEA